MKLYETDGHKEALNDEKKKKKKKNYEKLLRKISIILISKYRFEIIYLTFF